VTSRAARVPPPPAKTVVWLVEDNELFRRTVAHLIESTGDLACPVAVGSVEEALGALDAHLVPDIVLMDIGLPGLDGIEGVRRIRSLSPASRVLMLTVHEEEDKVFEAICAGASGYLLKPGAAFDIVTAIRQVAAGAAPMNAAIARKVLDQFRRLAPREPPAEGYGLTAREREILELLVEGLTMRTIAGRLAVSYHTIDTHLRNIYDKLHVRSRSGAVAKALKERLV
jgi:DNA-binding NarL/FixJ family response regulator